LAADGYNVHIVQNPLTSLAEDVAATDRGLDRIGGPSILVGHSYGGAATAAFMRDSQVPVALEAAAMATITVAAWRDKPTWYQLATADHVILPEAQRTISERAGATVVEVEGGPRSWPTRPKRPP
jgi:hypothetical protein